MGSSGSLALQLLIFGQTVTWLGLSFSLYLQWENRSALRDLQWLSETGSHSRSFEFPAEGRNQKVSANEGGGDPEGEFSNRKSRGPDGFREQIQTFPSEQTGLRIWDLFLILGWILVLLFGIGCWLQRKQQQPEIEEGVSSPSEKQRALAQRQLAEVRLRRNVFA